MEIELLSVEKLIPYVNNARIHGDEQVAQVAASIQEFGFTNPVLIDAKNGIIAGHGRVLAARKLGMKEVPCIRLTSLTEAQKKAYIIADNKLALNSSWDHELLAAEITFLKESDFDLSLTGFDSVLLENLLNSIDVKDKSAPKEFDEVGSDIEMDYCCPACGYEWSGKAK